MPHPDFGEGVIAIVVMDKNNNETFDTSKLINQLKKHLAAYKLPKIIFKFDELPLNGKSQKKYFTRPI